MDPYWNCVGVRIEDSGACTWYDGEQPCEYICDVGELPYMEYWAVSSVTVSDESSSHMRPSSGQSLGEAPDGDPGYQRPGTHRGKAETSRIRSKEDKKMRGEAKTSIEDDTVTQSEDVSRTVAAYITRSGS